MDEWWYNIHLDLQLGPDLGMGAGVVSSSHAAPPVPVVTAGATSGAVSLPPTGLQEDAGGLYGDAARLAHRLAGATQLQCVLQHMRTEQWALRLDASLCQNEVYRNAVARMLEPAITCNSSQAVAHGVWLSRMLALHHTRIAAVAALLGRLGDLPLEGAAAVVDDEDYGPEIKRVFSTYGFGDVELAQQACRFLATAGGTPDTHGTHGTSGTPDGTSGTDRLQFPWERDASTVPSVLLPTLGAGAPEDLMAAAADADTVAAADSVLLEAALESMASLTAATLACFAEGDAVLVPESHAGDTGYTGDTSNTGNTGNTSNTSDTGNTGDTGNAPRRLTHLGFMLFALDEHCPFFAMVIDLVHLLFTAIHAVLPPDRLDLGAATAADRTRTENGNLGPGILSSVPDAISWMENSGWCGMTGELAVMIDVPRHWRLLEHLRRATAGGHVPRTHPILVDPDSGEQQTAEALLETVLAQSTGYNPHGCAPRGSASVLADCVSRLGHGAASAASLLCGVCLQAVADACDLWLCETLRRQPFAKAYVAALQDVWQQSQTVASAVNRLLENLDHDAMNEDMGPVDYDAESRVRQSVAALTDTSSWRLA